MTKKKLTFLVQAHRVDAHGSEALCKEATIKLDTDLAGRTDAFNPAESIDFSKINPEKDAEPAFVEDVAYIRRNAVRFIEFVSKAENLHCTHIEPLVHGTWNSVNLLQPNQLVLKLSPWSNSYEVDFLKLASEKGLAVPNMVAHGDFLDERLPQAGYLLMDYIPHSANPDVLFKNKALAQRELNVIGENVASILAKLHEQKFDYIRNSDTKLTRWADAINLGQLEERGPFDGTWIREIEDIFSATKYSDYTQGHLIHSDANLNNVLIDKDDHSFKALIDPGPTIIGMPMFDLAYATWPWQYGLEYMDTVIDSYRLHSTNFDEQLFYTSLVFIAYQQAEYGNFKAEHMPFLEKYIYNRIQL